MFQALHRGSHKLVAVKGIKIYEKEKRRQMLNELKALIDTPEAPGLVAFLGAFYMPENGEISLVLEYMEGGSLADLVQSGGPVPEKILAQIARDVLRGLIHLHHDRRIVHRDIKPANILIGLDGTAKLSDFGISKYVDNTLAICATYCGTAVYMSPERIENQPYSFAADIWSLGLALLECSLGRFPYEGFTGPVDLMITVTSEPPPLPKPGVLSPLLHDFLAKCLMKEPGQRITAEQALQHPFVQNLAADTAEASAYIAGVLDVDNIARSQIELFLAHMFSLYDGRHEHVATMYSEAATLMLNGAESRGPLCIGLALADHYYSVCGKGGGTCTLDYVDCQRAPGFGSIAEVSLTLSPRGAPSIRFTFVDVFLISRNPANGDLRITNHIRRPA